MKFETQIKTNNEVINLNGNDNMQEIIKKVDAEIVRFQEEGE